MASLVLSMGLICSLNRAEEPATPSLPLELTTTCAPLTATPEMPAIKVPLCVPFVPIRILADSPATPLWPISMLLLPVVRLLPALYPRAMLEEPPWLLESVHAPSAVFEVPVLLL